MDYYGSRYYDQKVGVFLSADSVQGNWQGMNPYGYVNGNPETFADPTGRFVVGASGVDGGSGGVYIAPPFAGGGWAPPLAPPSFPLAPILTSGKAASSNGPIWSSKGTATTTVQQKASNLDSCSGGITGQALCGNFGVNFAVNFGPFQVGVPGEWNITSGSGGSDSGRGDRSGNNQDVNFALSDDSGAASGSSASQQGGSSPYQNEDGTLINADKAYIDVQGKFVNYALNSEHPVGANKAKVFRAVLGYDQSNYESLVEQIRQGVISTPGTPGVVNEYGARITVDIVVTGPNGGTAVVRTGWIYQPFVDYPKLTTLFVK